MVDIIGLSKEKVIIEKGLTNIAHISRRKKTTWVRAVSPKAEEIDSIVSFLEFDKEDTEDVYDFLKEGDRPRLHKEDHIEIVYSVPIMDDGDVITEPIVIYIKKNIIITIERKKLPVCERIENQLSKNKLKFILRDSPINFLSELLDSINDNFLTTINRIASRTDIISSKNSKLTQKQVEAISSASNTLAYFNQSVVANIEVLNGLRKLYFKGIKKEDREEFLDLYQDALHILDAEKVQREIVMNIFNMQAIISSNSVNEFMKKLTALALIIMVPTLISGIYGMNVNGLPFSQTKFAFAGIIGFMSLITMLIYFIFKKTNLV